MSALSDVSTSMTSKGFWSRPEGVTAMIFLALLGCTGVYFAGIIMPFIVTLLEDTITAIALCAVLAVIVLTLMQKRFWTLASYFFKSIMRAITGVFITIDPVGILKGYISTLKKRLEIMREQIESLRGQMRTLQEKIAKNEQAIDKSVHMAQAAQKAGKGLLVQQEARSADRKHKSNLSYEDLLKKMQAMYNALIKYSEASEYMIADINGEVEEAIEKKKLMDGASKAMGAAKKILMGGGDDAELYNETMESMADTYGQQLGQIENFMDMSKTFLDKVDIENAAAEDMIFQDLDLWSKKSETIMSDVSRKGLTAGAATLGTFTTATNAEYVPSGVGIATPTKKKYLTTT